MSRLYNRALRRQAAEFQQRSMHDHNMFYFSGSVPGLEERLSKLANNPNAVITEAYILLAGNEVKSSNYACLILTVIFGICLLFPLMFMCCNWWKQIAFARYEIPLSTYRKLQAIFMSPSIKSVTLRLYDNDFNKEKALFFVQTLSRSAIKNFQFSNRDPNENYTGAQFQDFKRNMKPIKTMPMISDIRWFNQAVE